MGSVTISRLPKTEAIQREIQTKLGTNIIVIDYNGKGFLDMFYN